MKNIRLRDLPSFIRTTDPNDFMTQFAIQETQRATKASAIILNTFDELEHDAVSALSSMFPPIFTIGHLQLLLQHPSEGLGKHFHQSLERRNPMHRMAQLQAAKFCSLREFWQHHGDDTATDG